MRSLQDAWDWYESMLRLLRIAKRLGSRYWDELPWDGRIGRDDYFRRLEGSQVASMAEGVLIEFDDLAVFVMFSVFEAIVRDELKMNLQPEIQGLQHPALVRSGRRLLQNISEGSFHANVLELLKRDGNDEDGQRINSVIEEVSRVRQYRNWVAHGRQAAERPRLILPRDAFDRLQAFLDEIRQAG